MNTFAPLAVQKVIGSSTAVSGALQMPRTIITIVLPLIAGAWVGKKAQNVWKSMVIATLLVGVPLAVLGFTTTNTSVMIYFCGDRHHRYRRELPGSFYHPCSTGNAGAEGTGRWDFSGKLCKLIVRIDCGGCIWYRL